MVDLQVIQLLRLAALSFWSAVYIHPLSQSMFVCDDKLDLILVQIVTDREL